MTKSRSDSQQPEAGEFAGYRAGFVALLGPPNVGKSTLMNALLGFKVSIVSPKPQTTRDRIAGILSDDASQIVFVDTPGVMEPKDPFNAVLRDSALEALDGADAVYHLVDAGRPQPLPPAAAAALGRSRKPVFLVVNKTDEWGGFTGEEAAEELLGRVPIPLDRGLYGDRVFFISALRKLGFERLLAATRRAMPESPPLYDPEQVTDRDMRFLAAEIVREKILENTAQEIPYSVAVRTESFEESPERKHLLRVAIYVEHESQKGMLIGQGGAMLRKIGSDARPDIEELVDHPVYLELWVKVRKNWRKNESDLRMFGYHSAAKKRKKR